MWRRRQIAYTAGLITGLCALGVLWLPGNAALHARGAMTPGHTGIDCAHCHVPAPGTIRQQLQAQVRHAFGHRATPGDFGRMDVGNAACLACHERPDDRHPVFRFLEPRFARARRELAPEQCLSCHLEHQGRRVTQRDPGFCRTCHEDTALRRDPIDIPHATLIDAERWETCLGCHDFHGNHLMKTARRVDEAHAPALLEAYFDEAPSPYGERRHAAREAPRHD